MHNKLFFILSLAGLAATAACAMSLREALQHAKASEPSLLSMQYQKEAKKTDIARAKSELYPKIDVTLGNTNRDYIMNSTGEKRKERYNSARLNVRQTIYNKEVLESVELAQLEQNQQEYKTRARIDEVLSEVVQTYAKALDAKSQAEAAAAGLRYQEVRLEQSRALFEKSMMSLEKYQQVRLDHNRANVKLQQSRNDLKVYKQMLKHYTGQKIETLQHADDMNPEIPSKEQIMQENAKLKTARSASQVAKQKITKAQAGHYPTLNLSASYSEFDSKTVYNDYKQEGRINLELRIPVFSGWQVTSATKREKKTHMASMQDLQKEKNSIRNRYEELILGLEIADTNIQTQKESLRIARDLVKSTQQAYRENKLSKVKLQETLAKTAQIRHELNKAQNKKLSLVYQLRLLSDS